MCIISLKCVEIFTNLTYIEKIVCGALTYDFIFFVKNTKVLFRPYIKNFVMSI